MNRKLMAVIVAFLLFSCATTGDKIGEISLSEAIELSAKNIATNLSSGNRVAIVAVDSESSKFSRFYIADELKDSLIKHGIEVTPIDAIEYVNRKLDFRRYDNTDDETSQYIGKFLGSDLAISVQLIHSDTSYQLKTRVIQINQSRRPTRNFNYNVRNDIALQDLINAFDNQELFLRLSVAETNSAGTLLDSGIVFASISRSELAISQFTSSIRMNPNFMAAYFNRGLVYSDIGEYDKAISDFNQAIRLDRNFMFAYFNRGLAYLDIGEHSKAIADFTQAINLDRNYSTAYNNRGFVHYINDNYDSAIADFTIAIQLDLKNAGTYNNRGRAYRDKGLYDKAIADFTEAIRIAPDYSTAYNNRGISYRRIGNYDLAIADYTEAIRIHLNNSDIDSVVYVYYNRATLYYLIGNYDQAILDCESVIRLGSDNADLIYTVNNILEEARAALAGD